MTLRTRLLLGYGYLVVLIVATAALAFVGLQRFRAGLDRVLRENVPSVQAAMRMQDELERENDATFSALLGAPRAAAELRDAEAAFDLAEGTAEQHAYTADERATLAALKLEKVALRQARQRLLTSGTTTLLASYDQEVAGRFAAVKRHVTALLAHNIEEIHRTEQATREEAFGFALGLAGLVVLALLSLGFMSRALQVTVLSRLSELTELGDAIAAGDRARRARQRHDDELGMLGRHLNVALDRQDALQATMEGRFNHVVQLLLGLLAHGPPAAVTALDGDIIASTLGPKDDVRLGNLAAEVRARKRGALAPMSGQVVRERVSDADGAFELALLVASGARAVGWLVTPAQSP